MDRQWIHIFNNFFLNIAFFNKKKQKIKPEQNKSILCNEFVVVRWELLLAIFEVRPRTCSLSAKARKLFKFSWATLTWPWYMKSKSNFKSSAFTSHIISTGSLVKGQCSLWFPQKTDFSNLFCRSSNPNYFFPIRIIIVLMYKIRESSGYNFRINW